MSKRTVWVIVAEHPDGGRTFGVAQDRSDADQMVEQLGLKHWKKVVDGDGLMQWKPSAPLPQGSTALTARCWEVGKPLGQTWEEK